ncbi:hypothetical protein [Cellulosimicrobium sp. Marseille-Q4280]|uniref:hypothetical protein n=1 Tax=Cellulosimicrobium sp. Marseille-Q4280 TaxID=2937992 RepID=UPI00203AB007|nr:hypothetical protein [Cellulosimicrobium sp. Marseille-Q4280]
MAAPNAQPDAGPPDDVPEPSPSGTPEPSGADRPDTEDTDPDGAAPADTEPDAAGPGRDDARAADADPEARLDVDARWAGIVAELGDLSDLDPGPVRPAPGDAEAPGRGTAPGTGEAPRGRDVIGSVPVAPWVQPPGPRDWPATPEVEALEEAESHFVPPDPPLVLGRDPLLTMAWSLVVGVPVVLLVLLVVARPFPVVVAQVGGLAFLAGLAVLLWRMPHRRDDDDPGPGAVV